MTNFIKAAVLGVGLLAGVSFVAQAQSVSTLPPSAASTQTTATPYASTSRIVPDPGGSVNIRDQHYQAPAGTASNWSDHPYSGSIDGAKSGPKPN
jgi:hypothetical protein